MAETTRASAAEFLEDVREQVRKVTWPDWPQLKSSTGVIIAFVAVVAVVIFLIDLVVRGGLSFIASVFGG